MTGVGKIRRVQFPGGIMARLQLRDPPGVDVEADHRAGPGKGDRQRQPDIAEPDHRDPFRVRHVRLSHMFASKNPRIMPRNSLCTRR